MLIPPTVRAVFFDAVGTLIHPEPISSGVYAAVGKRYGSCLEAAAIAARFRIAFERQEEIDRTAGWRTSEAREIERWRQIVAEVLDDVSDRDACFTELYNHFRRPDSWRCDPAAAVVLPALAARGYQLGIASNFDHRLRTVVAGLSALAGMGQLVISSEVGWRKPAHEFFACLGQRTGLSSEQILFVGNDRRNDYDGAKSAGLHALLLDPHECGSMCIGALTELLAACEATDIASGVPPPPRN